MVHRSVAICAKDTVHLHHSLVASREGAHCLPPQWYLRYGRIIAHINQPEALRDTLAALASTDAAKVIATTADLFAHVAAMGLARSAGCCGLPGKLAQRLCGLGFGQFAQNTVDNRYSAPRRAFVRGPRRRVRHFAGRR